MLFAKSLYKGGEIFHAEECNYKSSKKLGLVCVCCYTPVFLKSGSSKRDHFAHSKDKGKECFLRSENDATNFYSRVSNIVVDRGQRRAIFEQHFFSLATYHYAGDENDKKRFNQWLREKENLDGNQFKQLETDSVKLFKWLRKQDICSIFPSVAKTDNLEYQTLADKICIEALNFLIHGISEEILTKLLLFCIYTLTRQENNENPKLIKPENICIKLIEMILENHWNKALEAEVIEELIKKRKQKKNRRAKKYRTDYDESETHLVADENGYSISFGYRVLSYDGINNLYTEDSQLSPYIKNFTYNLGVTETRDIIGRLSLSSKIDTVPLGMILAKEDKLWFSTFNKITDYNLKNILHKYGINENCPIRAGEVLVRWRILPGLEEVRSPFRDKYKVAYWLDR